MALNGTGIDYASRDYEAFKQNMLNLIRDKVPEWTNVVESDPGVVILELVAHVLDNMAYYQDVKAREMFIDSAQLRSSVKRICNLIGYPMLGAQPATTSIYMTITPADTDRTLPKGSTVAASGSNGTIYFEAEEDYTILANTSEHWAQFREGRTVTDILGIGTGGVNQSFAISRASVVQPHNLLLSDAITVAVDSGSGYEAWTRVENILDCKATDKAWYFTADDDDMITIHFGNGVNGAVVPLNASVRATMIVGGGTIGNVAAGTITQKVSMPSWVTSVTNNAAVDNGTDRETIDHARVYGPKSLAPAGRAVTVDDYKTLAGKFPGVGQAGAQTETITGNIISFGVYITGLSSFTPSSELKGLLTNYLETVKIGTDIVTVKAAVVDYVNVTVTVYVKATAYKDIVKAAAETALANWYAVGEFDLGEADPIGNVYEMLSALDGVDHVTITKHCLTPVVRTIKNSGNLSVGSFTITPTITEESWLITMLDATHFKVTGDSSGLQTGMGTCGTAWTNDAGTLTFTVTGSGATGDSLRVRTSLWNGDIVTEDIEVVAAGTITVTTSGGLSS